MASLFDVILKALFHIEVDDEPAEPVRQVVTGDIPSDVENGTEGNRTWPDADSPQEVDSQQLTDHDLDIFVESLTWRGRHGRR